MAKDWLTLPWMPWMPPAFRSDPAVIAMEREEQWRYRDALDFSWMSRTPGIGTEDEWRRWCGYTERQWPEHRERIAAAFRVEGTTWTQRRLLEDWTRATEKSRKARASAGMRWQCDRISERTSESMRPHSDRNAEREVEREVPTTSASAEGPKPPSARNGTRKPDAWDEAFGLYFWPKYPRKVARAAAAKAWAKIKPPSEDRWQDMLDTVCGGLDNSLAAWNREARTPDKIPHATTWLNQRRWEDETP